MKILYVAPRFHTNQHTITKYLLEQGHEVMFLVARKESTEDYTYITPILCEPSSWYEKIEKRKFPEASVAQENYRINHFIPSRKWMTKIIKDFAPDILIARERTLFSMVAIRCARRCGVKCRILYTQSPLYRNHNSIMKSIMIGLYDFLAPVKSFITSCEVMVAGQDKSKLVKNKNWVFVPLVSDVKSFVDGRTYMRDGLINIIDVGKFRPYKNHQVLVDAVAKLSKEIRGKIRVTILGQCVKEEEQDNYSAFKKYVTQKGLDDTIIVRKNTPYKEMEKEYMMNDVLVLTSKIEKCSVTMSESLSYGLLTISTDHNGSASYIDQGSGFIFKTCSAESLAEILKGICEHPERVSLMGKHARQTFLANFTPEVYWKKIMEIYNK